MFVGPENVALYKSEDVVNWARAQANYHTIRRHTLTHTHTYIYTHTHTLSHTHRQIIAPYAVNPLLR